MMNLKKKLKNLWLTITFRIRCGSKLINPENYIKMIHHNIGKYYIR